MVYNPDNEWVSEPGTARVMSIAQEPHSINEMGEKREAVAETTEHKSEPTLTSQPGSDPDHAASKEPSDSADQMDAAKERLASTVAKAKSNKNQWAVYAVAAALGLLVVSEVL